MASPFSEKTLWFVPNLLQEFGYRINMLENPKLAFG